MACNPCDVSSMLIGARNSGFPTVPLVLGVKWGPAHAAGIVNGGDRWAELAGDEGVESAKAVGEFGVTQPALAVKPAQKIEGGAFSFLGIAFQTAGNQVAGGIAAELGERHDVVKAPGLGRKLTQTIKATAMFPSMDGPSEGRGLQEILPLGVDGGEKGGRDRATSSIASIESSGVCSEDLFRQENLNHMSGFATLHKTQEAARDETTDGPARRVAAEADTARKPRNRKPEAGLAFQTAMAHEI